MARGKCCGYCGNQKRHHPKSEYLKIWVKPHKWVAEDDEESIKKLEKELEEKRR